jgi:hypothetical protein
LLILRDFKLKDLEKAKCNNDPTQKFALPKKDKQAADLLMQLEFNSAEYEVAGGLQPFEKRI